MSPRSPNPNFQAGHRQLADDVRQAAFDVCAAARRLEALAQERQWRYDMLIRPTYDDLADARARLDAVLAKGKRPTPLPVATGVDAGGEPS